MILFIVISSAWQTGAFVSSSSKRAPLISRRRISQSAHVHGVSHVPTAVEPTGAGKVAAAIPNRELAQGKRVIWDNSAIDMVVADERLRWELQGARKLSIDEYHLMPASPALEVMRLEAYANLRTWLIDSCMKEARSPPPLLAFERWQFEAKAAEDEERHRRTDPLLPSSSRFKAKGLCNDLTRIVGMKSPMAESIASGLQRQSAAEAARLKIVASADLVATSLEIAIVRNRHNLDLQRMVGGAAAGPKCKLNYEHEAKLRALWSRYRVRVGDSETSIEGEGDQERAFVANVYCLLSRYQTLGGHGFQSAVGEAAFRVLVARLNVQVECFASPLNCHLPHFCSAFPDTDANFGSLGSFFRLNVTRGSFECNPPFVPGLMKQAVDHATALLVAANEASSDGHERPLSFAFVVPGWKEDPGYRALVENSFIR